MIIRLISSLLFSILFISILSAQTIPVQLNGAAINIGGDCYRITPDALTQAGSLWALDSLDLTEDFLVDFSFYLGDNDAGADGIAFLLQPISTSIGTTGGGIGYEGVSPSLGLEFDTWQNIDLNDPTFDHLALQQNGDLDHLGPNNLSSGTVPILDAVTNAEDDMYHNCQVTWDADSMLYSVYVDCELKLEYTGDIVNNIFGGDPFVFYGFTSATGGASNDHEVCINQFGSLSSDTTYLCEGDIFLLTGPAGYVSYLWSPGNLVLDSTAQFTLAFPDQSTDFVCTAFDQCGNTYVFSSFAEVENCNPGECPDTYIVPLEANLCSGEAYFPEDGFIALLNGTTIPYDSLSIWNVYLDSVAVDSSGLVFFNSDCTPLEIELDIEFYCISDSAILHEFTRTIVVYPTDISAFLSPIESDCSVEVDVLDGCEDLLLVDTIPGIAPGDSGQFDINVSYLYDCAPDVTVPLTYDCPLCELTGINVNVLACDDDSYLVEVDLSGEDIGTSFSLLDESGNDLGAYNYSDLPVTVGPFIGDNSIHSLTAVDSDNPACLIESEEFSQYCPVCELTDMTISTLDCVGGTFGIELDIEGVDLGSTFTLSDDQGNILGSYNYTDLPLTLDGFSGDNLSTYSFTATDDNDTDCSIAGPSFGPVACYVCDITNLDYSITCNSEDSVSVSISFSGSNSYIISDGNQTAVGLSAGSNVFTSTYPENSDIIITITDELADACSESIEIDGIDCNCESVAGTIMANSLNVCADDISVVDADDFLLEPGQSVYYLYHNQPIVNANSLPDIISDVYATGSFLTNDGSSIPCGSLAYVTAFGANEDSDNPGFPDYTDFCMTISNTLPIQFLCPIVITLDESCDTNNGESTISITCTGGLPEIDPTEEYTITGDYYNGTVAAGTITVVGPIADLSSITVTISDNAGCSASITELIECEKLPVELLEFSGSVEARGNLIEWSTASEIENDYFILEKSTDGIEYAEVSRIEGQGTVTSLSIYSYLDEDFSILNYYRLHQVDYDGSKENLGIIVLERSELYEPESIQIYPSVFEASIQISITAPKDENINLTLYDAMGRIYSSEQVSVIEGSNLISRDYSSLAIGTYFIKLESQNINATKKIVKR